MFSGFFPPCTHRLPILFLFMVFAVPLAHRVSGADPQEADELKSQADRWIDLEKRIADERNAWRSEKEILETSVDVLKREQSLLQTKVEANRLATELFSTRLEQAQTELAEHEAAHRKLNAAAASLERRIEILATQLPPPLLQKVAPLIEKVRNQTPESPLSTAERTQTLVSALSTIDLFNNTLTLTHQLREDNAGTTLDVKVLYWGLAMAYAVDAPGKRAWLLTPGGNGWEWHDRQASADRIKALFDIYEKLRGPDLIDLPVNAMGGAQ